MRNGSRSRLLLPGALLLLSGCTVDLAMQDERASHPITVQQRQLLARFERPAPGQALSGTDRDRLRRLADESLRRGAGPIIVASGDAGFTDTLVEQLTDLGAAARAAPDSDGAATATVSLPVWVALAPECGQFDRGITPDFDNMPHSNWGCSLQHNLAVMVQNPADLARSSVASGRDANRSADVLDKYGRGQPTGSIPEGITVGSTSSVGH